MSQGSNPRCRERGPHDRGSIGIYERIALGVRGEEGSGEVHSLVRASNGSRYIVTDVGRRALRVDGGSHYSRVGSVQNIGVIEVLSGRLIRPRVTRGYNVEDSPLG